MNRLGNDRDLAGSMSTYFCYEYRLSSLRHQNVFWDSVVGIETLISLSNVTLVPNAPVYAICVPVCCIMGLGKFT